MTAQTRPTLKAEFEDGDVPSGSNYVDWLDSFVSLSDTTAQSMSSPLVVTTITATTEVSAAVVNAVTLDASAASFREMSAATAFVSGAACVGSLFIGGSQVLPAGAGAIAEVYWTATATTSFAGAGTYTTIRGTTSAESTFLVEFEHTSSAGEHEIKYIGAGTKSFHMHAHISFEVQGNSKLAAFRFAKNGTTLVKSQMQRFVGTGSDVGAVGLGTLVSLVSGDTVDVQMTNMTDTTEAVVKNMTIVVQQT